MEPKDGKFLFTNLRHIQVAVQAEVPMTAPEDALGDWFAKGAFAFFGF
ncbi:MAG: hypothetical protein ABJR46_15925 [Tateyamaria sp.]